MARVSAGARVVALAVIVLGAVLVSVGFILVATIPSFLFFWIIVPTVAGLLVWMGVLSAGFTDEPAPATAG